MKDGALAEEEEKQSGVGGGSKKIKRGVRRPRHRRMPESMHITGEEKQRPCITSMMHATLMLFLGSPAEATRLEDKIKAESSEDDSVSLPNTLSCRQNYLRDTPITLRKLEGRSLRCHQRPPEVLSPQDPG